jgi:hypothetical protein
MENKLASRYSKSTGKLTECFSYVELLLLLLLSLLSYPEKNATYVNPKQISIKNIIFFSKIPWKKLN